MSCDSLIDIFGIQPLSIVKCFHPCSNSSVAVFLSHKNCTFLFVILPTTGKGSQASPFSVVHNKHDIHPIPKPLIILNKVVVNKKNKTISDQENYYEQIF